MAQDYKSRAEGAYCSAPGSTAAILLGTLEKVLYLKLVNTKIQIIEKKLSTF